MSMLLLVVIGLVYSAQSQTLECMPDEADHDALAQFVFIYGTVLRLSDEEKTAIGFTVFNRVADPNFPNSTVEVVNWEAVKRGKTKKYYGKLARANLLSRWNRAKDGDRQDYQSAQLRSRDILCGGTADPTGGATDFSKQPTPRLFHAPRFLRSQDPGNQIGNLYFFKLAPAAARRRGGGRGNGGRLRGGHNRRPGRGPGGAGGRRRGGASRQN